jgi:cytidine deaminase
MNVVDAELFRAAVEFARTRYPEGDALVAALRTETGSILTSVPAEARLTAAELCAETGAICEAHKLDQRVIASLCLYRESTEGPYRAVPACGVCQERLAYWGLEVAIAVPADDGRLWQSKTLEELRPYYWGRFHE